MEARSAPAPRSFDHLREHSIGLPQVLFQLITHMAPAAAGKPGPGFETIARVVIPRIEAIPDPIES
jgi:hypothetical protein